IAHRGRNDQRSLTAYFHADDAFVPAAYHFAGAENESERRLTVARAVEFGAFFIRLGIVIYPPGVMNDHRLSRNGFGTTTLFYIDFSELRRHGIQLATSLLQSAANGTSRTSAVEMRESCNLNRAQGVER